MPRTRNWLFFEGTWVDLVAITVVVGLLAGVVIFFVWLVAGKRRQ